jgi:hypothetical protein
LAPIPGCQSYLCFSRAFSDKPIVQKPRRTTQEFFGSPDLDIPPAKPGAFQAIARIYVQGETSVAFATKSKIEAALLNGATRVAGNKPAKTGWYEIGVSASAAAPVAFDLSVTYTGGRM